MAAVVELILLSRINAKALWKAISNLCIDPTAPAVLGLVFQWSYQQTTCTRHCHNFMQCLILVQQVMSSAV